uniref:hypothetical protein n=1 Tax=Streptomyces sp. NRRL F-2664 TaxID=1463842 RepID=UPI00131A6F69
MDARTGRFSLEVPLLGTAGRGEASFGLVLSYDQELSGLGVDRLGLGAGMGLGLPFVDTGEGRAMVAGGVWEIDTERAVPGGTGSGLKRFAGEGVRFEHVPGGSLPAREGVEGRGYEWRLADRRDGSVQYFDADGNPVAFADRHGNRTDFAFTPAGGDAWQLASVTDPYGAVTGAVYDEGRVVFTGPARSGDGHRLTAVLELEEGKVRRITGSDAAVTSLEYEQPLSGHGAVVSRVVSPLGAVTEIGYEELAGAPVAALVASRVRVLDAEGVLAAPEQRVNVSVEEGRSYTGSGSGGGFAGEDDVFDQRSGYTYASEVSFLGGDGEAERRVVSRYNSLHLLTSQQVFTSALGERAAGSLERVFSWQNGSDSPAPPPKGEELPADWASPVREANTVYNSAGGSREVATTAAYDSFGRPVRTADETGAVTEIVYDTEDGATGLVLSQKVADRDGKVLQETANTLSADRRTVTGTVTRTADSSGKLTAREQTTFTYDKYGQPASQTTAWADGAGEEGRGEGPGELKTVVSRTVEGGRLTEAVTTAAGTDAQTTTARTIDLATGAVLEEMGPGGRVVSRTEYDRQGRPSVHTVLPDSDKPQTTRIAYPSPAVTVTATPDGRRITETLDALGRPLRTADNYRDGAYAKEPDADGARTLSEADYSQWAHYRVTMTDQAGRKTVASSDPWGHTSSVTGPDGTTVKTASDIVAEAVTRGILGTDQKDAGLGEARAVSVQDADSTARTTSTRVVFADGTPAAGSAARTDALGRTLASTSSEVTTTPSYGPGGIPQSAVLNPAAPDAYPGQEFTAALTRDLAGRQTAKSLTQGDPGQGDTRTGVRSTYDPAGRLASQTDQLGNTTAYTYTPDGQVAEAVVQAKDGKLVSKTAHTYDRATGLRISSAVADASGATTVRQTEYDALNRVTGIWEGARDDADAKKNTLITYAYDSEGRLASTAYPDGKTTSRTYNQAGQLVSATDAAGAVTAYTYNPDGSLAKAVQKTADGQQTSAAYTYDSLGRVSRTEYGNGTVLTVDYYDSGQPKKETLTRKDGTLLSETAYTYNTRGDLATRTDTRPTTSPAPGSGSGSGSGSREGVQEGASGRQEDASAEGSGGAGAGGGTPVTTHTVHGYDAYGRLTSTVLHGGGDAKAPVLRSTAYTAN